MLGLFMNQAPLVHLEQVEVNIQAYQCPKVSGNFAHRVKAPPTSAEDREGSRQWGTEKTESGDQGSALAGHKAVLSLTGSGSH